MSNFTDSEEQTTTIRKEHTFDISKLVKYIASQDLGKVAFKEPVEIKQFNSGQSNPSFYLKDANNNEFVLRKKPPGKLLPSAHQIEREFLIMNSLFKIKDFPVPETYFLCEDNSIIGTPFYLMKFIKGRIFRDNNLPNVSVPDRREIYEEFVNVLARLHKVDFNAIGLGNFAKHTGYIERTISTWSRQYQNSETEKNRNNEQFN